MNKIKRKEGIKRVVVLLIILTITTMISIFGNASIFNKFKCLNTDISVWTNIAKQIQNGKVIYRDIFDHKGPILYFFYYIGYFIGKINGIAFIDFICIFIDSVMIYRIAKKMNLGRLKSILTTLICMFLIPIICFGNSENPCSESLSLPFILISLYAFINFIYDKKFGKWESIYTGICFGIVAMIRVNLAILWVVFEIYIYMQLIKQKEYKRLINIIFFSVIGVCIVIFPIIIYLVSNNAFKNFIDAYFLLNIKYSTIREYSTYETVLYFIIFTWGIFILPLVLSVILVIVFFKKKEKKIIILNFLYTIFITYLIISPGRKYPHYMIPLVSTMVIPIVFMLKNIKIDKRLIFMMYIIVFLFLCIMGYDQIQIYNSDEWTANQYDEYSKLINTYSEKNDSILQIGKKTQIYLWANRSYNGKYFFQIPFILYDEEYEKQFIEEVKYCKPKIILNFLEELEELDNKDNINEIEKKFKEDIKEIIENKYIEINDFLYVRREE